MTLVSQLIFLYPIYSSKIKIHPHTLQSVSRSWGERYIISQGINYLSPDSTLGTGGNTDKFTIIVCLCIATIYIDCSDAAVSKPYRLEFADTVCCFSLSVIHPAKT